MPTLFVALVLGLFVAGIAWRATHPPAARVRTDPERQLRSRQDGYYLCLRHPPPTAEAVAAYVTRRLPRDDRFAAARGCREALRR